MQWVVVQVKGQCEEQAVRNLEETGFTCHLPRLTLRKGIRTETKPMFKGYIFVQIEPEDMPLWRTINSHRGVIRILSNKSGKPKFLPVGLVEHMIELGDVVENITTLMEYHKGQKIRFTAGPLSGINGVVHWNNRERVALLVDLLGTDTIVQSTVHMIAPV